MFPTIFRPVAVLFSARRARQVCAQAALLLSTLLVGAMWGKPAEAAEIVVAQVAPFSGPQAVTGRAISAGVRLYFDAVNAAGGVRGRTIRLITRDDEQKPELTVRHIRALLADEPPAAFIGTVGTTNLLAVARDGTLAARKVAMVGGVSGASAVARAPNIYVLKASYRDEVARLLRQLAANGITRVAVVYQDDELGQEVVKAADDAAPAAGAQVVVRASYPRNTVAVDAAVQAVRNSQAQAVVLGATSAAGIEFLRRSAATKGMPAIVYGLSIIDTDLLLKSLGPEQARGYAFSVVLPLNTDSRLPVVREYIKLRQGSTDPDLTARSLEGFLAAKLLVKVFEGLGDPTPAAVNAALSRPQVMDLGGYTVDYGDRGRSPSSYIDFAVIGAGGRIVK